MAKNSLVTQEFKRTDTQLSFMERFHPNTIRSKGPFVILAAAIVLSGGFQWITKLYELLADFTLSAMGDFLVTSLSTLLYSGIALLIIILASSNADMTIVFDKATHELRLEKQRKVYRWNQGKPVTLQVEPLSNISRVAVDVEAVETNSLGVTQTQWFEPVTILGEADQPIYVINLAITSGPDPYEDRISPQQLAAEIQDFLGLQDGET